MKRKKGILGMGFLLIFIGVYPAMGLTLNKTISCPQGIDEQALMDLTIKECERQGYSPKQEGNKIVLTKGYEHGCAGSVGMSRVLYKITPALDAGKDGSRVLTLGGEYIGKPKDKGHRGECFECEMDQIEKAVMKYLEGKR